MQRVERRPVGVGDGTQRVPAVRLVGEQVVALLRHPGVHGGRRIGGQVAAGVPDGAGVQRVVRLDRERFPLAPDDVRRRPPRYVRIVPARGVAGAGRQLQRAVDQVHHVPHLGPEGVLPRRIVEVMLGGQLGPDPLHQPERLSRMRQVPRAEGPVEGRRQDRVHPDHVRVHGGQRVEPARVCGGVLREFGGELPRQRHAEVHALHVEGDPAPHRVPHLESRADGPRDEREGVRSPPQVERRAVPVGRGVGEQRAQVLSLGRQRERPPRGPRGRGGIAAPPGRSRHPFPRVDERRVAGQRRGEE